MFRASILPVLGTLKWPLTIAGAVLVFGLSSEGTLSLVAVNSHKLTTPIAVTPSFNIPPIRQIGELNPVAAVPKAPNDSGTTVPGGFAKSTTTIALTQPEPQGATLLPPSTSTEVPFKGTARIGSSAVKVRESADKSSASIGVLAAGTPVQIGEQSGGWLRVRHQDGEGWVYSTYIDNGVDSKVAAVTIRGGADRPVDVSTVSSKGKLVEAGSRIVVKDFPDANGATVFRLEIGEKVRIVERKGQWSRIATASGEGGWIRVKQD